ncbi:MAG: transposase [Collinsella intestinalis]
MSGEEKRRRPAPSATPWDGAGDGELSPAERIVRDCHRDMYRYRHAGAGLVGEADFFNGYDRDACPRCGSPAIEGNGRDANGVRRWRCLSCGRAFNPATGTVFDGRKLPVADWTEFLLEVFSYGSLGAARSGRRSATTPPYWLAKLLAVLEGAGGRRPGRPGGDRRDDVPAAAGEPAEDARRLQGPGGFSKGKHCIGIGCDGSGASVFADEGLGKTSGARTLAAFGGHVARGSTLVHDMENGHNRLVRELGLRSERHNSKLIKRLPDPENPLAAVNRLCYLLRLFLDSHTGFDRTRLGGYLDLFWVMMNPPRDKMEKAAFVLDRAMRNPKTLRYRDFYARSPSSDDEESSS